MTTHLWYGVYTQHIPSNGLTYHRHRTRPDDTERELCLYTSSLTSPHTSTCTGKRVVAAPGDERLKQCCFKPPQSRESNTTLRAHKTRHDSSHGALALLPLLAAVAPEGLEATGEDDRAKSVRRRGAAWCGSI